MNSKKMPQLKIGDLVVEKPIIQGGMGVGISLSGLASAVANAGGIGVISSVVLGILFQDERMKLRERNIYFLREEIRKARKLTDGILGVNLMVAVSDYQDLLQCVIEEEIDLAIMGAGLPLRFPKRYSAEEIRGLKTRFAPIVSSGRAAQLIFRQWEKNFGRVPDAVVVEGPLAGGHLGFKRQQIEDPAYALEKIFPDVLQAVEPYQQRFGKEIPVIAAGGIYTGADIHKFLEMGAKGVQMATRFVATHECDASDEFKQSYIHSRKEDVTIIQSPVGLPGRAIRNKFLDEVSAGARIPIKCPWKCLKTCDYRTAPYCIAEALKNAQVGELLQGFTFAGANAYKVDKIISVKELFDALEQEYAEAEMEEMLV